MLLWERKVRGKTKRERTKKHRLENESWKSADCVVRGKKEKKKPHACQPRLYCSTIQESSFLFFHFCLNRSILSRSFPPFLCTLSLIDNLQRLVETCYALKSFFLNLTGEMIDRALLWKSLTSTLFTFSSIINPCLPVHVNPVLNQIKGSTQGDKKQGRIHVQ